MRADFFGGGAGGMGPRHRIRLRPDALTRRVNFVLVFGLLEMQHPSTCRNVTSLLCNYAFGRARARVGA